MPTFGEISSKLLGTDESSIDPMTGEEREALQRSQELLNQASTSASEQMRLGDLLRPELFQALGIGLEFDESGQISGFSGGGDRFGGGLNTELTQQLFANALEASRGELATDPVLMRDLEERENQVQRRLIKQFGSLEAAQRSSAGSEILSDFEAERFGAIHQARRRDVQDFTSLALGSRQMEEQIFGQAFNLAQSLTTPDIGTILGGFNNIQQSFAQNRFQIGENIRKRDEFYMDFSGEAISTMATAASDRRLKRNIKHIGYFKEVPIYMFNYIWDNVKHIGGMADEIKKLVPEAVERIGQYDVVHYDKLVSHYGNS